MVAGGEVELDHITNFGNDVVGIKLEATPPSNDRVGNPGLGMGLGCDLGCRAGAGRGS